MVAFHFPEIFDTDTTPGFDDVKTMGDKRLLLVATKSNGESPTTFAVKERKLIIVSFLAGTFIPNIFMVPDCLRRMDVGLGGQVLIQ